MKLRLFLLSFILIISGCRADFDFKWNRLSDFGRDFINLYGWPEGQQNWSTAIQYKLQVFTDFDGTCNLKVYSGDPVSDPRKAYLLGNFSIEASTGENSVLVDGPYTLKNLYVGIEQEGQSVMKEVPTEEDGKQTVAFSREELSDGTLPQATKMSYYLAYEVVDSTSTFWDYNDVVIEIERVSGEPTAELRLKAVGALEYMSLVYREATTDIMLIENLHAVFGYQEPITRINVMKGFHNFRNPIVLRNMKVGEDFSIVKDAHKFVVKKKPEKGKVTEYAFWPDRSEYYGLPPYTLLVANPIWNWTSEGYPIEKEQLSFPYWLKEYHLYNNWWDYLWDAFQLYLCEDGSYRPDFNYEDMVIGPDEITNAEGEVLEISYERLEPYIKCDVGINVAFAILGRNHGTVNITITRSDDGYFELYDEDAFVNVYGEYYNVDNGIGFDAEACHIFLTTKTIKQVVAKKASLLVHFNKGTSNATLNSVWIRER